MNKLPTYERCTVCNTQMLPSGYKCGTCQRCADYLDGVKMASPSGRVEGDSGARHRGGGAVRGRATG